MLDEEDLIRPAFTAEPPEADASKALVICNSRNFTPSIIQQLVGGAYDPLVFPMGIDDTASGRGEERVFINGMMSIASMAFKLHKPPRIILITDDDNPVAMIRLINLMPEIVKERACLDYEPKVSIVHIRSTDRIARFEDQDLYFPLRHADHLICGCIDPRLARVRTEMESKYENASWFTVPGCVNALNIDSRDWHAIRRWLKMHLWFAKKALGMKYLMVSPHEDCKAHPVPLERTDANSLAGALRQRVRDTKRAIKRLQSCVKFRGIDVHIAPVCLNGRPLAVITRRSRGGRRGRGPLCIALEPSC